MEAVIIVQHWLGWGMLLVGYTLAADQSSDEKRETKEQRKVCLHRSMNEAMQAKGLPGKRCRVFLEWCVFRTVMIFRLQQTKKNVNSLGPAEGALLCSSK